MMDTTITTITQSQHPVKMMDVSGVSLDGRQIDKIFESTLDGRSLTSPQTYLAPIVGQKSTIIHGFGTNRRCNPCYKYKKRHGIERPDACWWVSEIQHQGREERLNSGKDDDDRANVCVQPSLPHPPCLGHHRTQLRLP